MLNYFYKILCLNILLYNFSSGSLWPCPNTGCLSFPPFWPKNYRGDFLDLWDCKTNCDCHYDEQMVITGSTGNCAACGTSLKGKHKTPIPTQLNSCDDESDQFVCEEGYYFSSDIQTCSKCAIIPPDLTCADGYYFERCQTSRDSTSCKPCENAIANETSQQYGPYIPTQSCSLLDFEMIDGIANCAPYLTPLWDDYKCSIQCKTNFIDALQGSGPFPQCVPCYEFCSVGETCYGGSYSRCQSCDGPLGANKMWIKDIDIYDPPCRSTCAYGFYFNTAHDCIPCLENQKCFNTSEIFMGCREYSPGICQPATLECVSGESYLSYAVFSKSVECRECSLPVMGETYVSSDCTIIKNTVLKPCTTQCPVGYYKTQNCSLNSDSICIRCTDPKTMIGMHLIGDCKGETDYSFTECESGKGCDGSTVYDCMWPMVATRGVCRCPLGTYPVGGKCTAVWCPDGQYPDANTGNCTPCTNHNPNHDSITLKNVWGEDACACQEGHFIEKTQQVPPIRCWPCGDLTCAQGIQYQTPCPGILTDFPECLCRLPPGVQASQDGKCHFSLCEDGLNMSSIHDFSGMAEATPMLWDTSFWIENTEGTLDITLDPFFSISSLAIVSPDFIVSVVNRTSLWVTLISGESGLINNDLIIFGNRNLSGNILLDMTICRDSVENRFWISFMMLTSICGGVEPNLGDELILCSNLELIRISVNPCEQDLCLPIPQTGLYAENVFSLWGDDIIGSGIPRKRFFAMTMQHYANNNLLYILVGGATSYYASEVYTYDIQYYDPGISHDQRKEMVFHVFLSDGNRNDIITCVVWVQDTIWALVNGYLRVLSQTKQNSGIMRLLQSLREVKFLHLSRGPREGILLAITSIHTNRVYEIDVWNGLAVPRYMEYGISRILTDFELLITLHQYTNTIQVKPIKTICQQDHISFFNAPCSLQPCLSLQDACGPHSLRSIGSTTCKCSPGYFLDIKTNLCQICPLNAFCLGDAPPQPCPSNSIAALGSQSLSQCLCQRGHYKFKQNLCIPCPQGFWCYGQQMPPIKCTSGSSTRSVGSQSPIECECEIRTRGIDCRPCDSKDICIFLDAAQSPRVSSIYLSGSGPMNADSILNKTCLNWGTSIVYSLPWSGLQQSVGSLGKIWTWLIVVEPLPTTADDTQLLTNISLCMIQNGFFIEGGVFVYTPLNRITRVQSAKSCGLNYEWSGDINVQQCACIAGYERVSTLNSWCSPCAPQSIRRRRSQGTCMPCLDNNSHAPWPAMDHCICKDGYYMEHVSQTCNPKLIGFESYNIISSPLVMIPLSLTAVILCILCSSFMSLRGI